MASTRILFETEMSSSEVAKLSKSTNEGTVATEEMTSADDSFTCNTKSGTVVRFALDKTTEILVETIDDMTKLEQAAKWYSRGEYDIIRAQNSLTVKLMKIGRENPENFGHCYRGLEYRRKDIKKRRDVNMSRAFSAVFDEQQRQRDEDCVCSEMLATVYEGYTMLSVDSALRAARKDAAEAAAYQEESVALVTDSKPPVEQFDVTDDDDVSVLSDGVADLSLGSDEKSIVKRFKSFVQKRRSATMRSNGSVTSGTVPAIVR